MSIATQETETTATAQEAKVSRSAITAYREGVFNGVCDETVLFDARRIRAEWDADRRVFERRQRACETLTAEVPRLEAAAVDARRATADAETFARCALPDTMTLGELRAKIRTANAKLSVSTPAELAAGLRFLSAHIVTLRSQLVRAEGAVRDAQDRARHALIETGAKAGPDTEVAKLGAKIEALQRRIASRREVLGAEGKLAPVRAECEALARGDRPPTFSSYHAPGQQPTPLATLYRVARQKLDRLLDLVARKPDAEKDNARDCEELVGLQAKLAEAHREALQRLADQRTMKWTNDQ